MGTRGDDEEPGGRRTCRYVEESDEEAIKIGL
jgi:hypothetical protein